MANYRIQFKDSNGIDCTVRLIQDENAALDIPLTGADTPLTIVYTLEDESDVFSTIGTSKATIKVVLDGSNIDFLEEMAVLEEGQYRVDVEVKDLAYWKGWLIPDEQTRSFSEISSTIQLTAVDNLTRMKGKQLLDSDGAFITGKHTLKEYVQYCFNRVNKPGSPDFIVVSSDLVLSNDTSYVFPSILEQLSVYAEAFNDDMGRPINCYDVIRMIAESLCMRVFYSYNTLFFIDMLNFVDEGFTYPGIKIGLKDDNTGHFFIKNSENITTVKVFSESIASFEYGNLVGLMIDGYLEEWEPESSGQVLSHWSYNSTLLSKSDYNQRKQGTGRKEAPYGILLKGVSNQPDEEMIGGVSDYAFHLRDIINVSFTVKLTHPELILPTISGSPGFNIWLDYSVVVYNETFPEISLYYYRNEATNTFTWGVIDLTGSDFASGKFDFAAYISAVGSAAYIQRMSLVWTGDKQTVDVTLPPMALLGDRGTVFVALSNAITQNNISSGTYYDQADLIVYNVLVTKVIPKTKGETHKGEIVYISREADVSSSQYTKEISFNTTANDNVAGSLLTDISYTTTGGTVIPAGTVTAISRKRTNVFDNVSLLQYNAMVRMIFNFNQYMIDFEMREKSKTSYVMFEYPLDFSALYNPLRPSTDIYNNRLLQTRNEYDVRNAERKITAVTMKVNQRAFSRDTLDDTHDFVEFYYLT